MIVLRIFALAVFLLLATGTSLLKAADASAAIPDFKKDVLPILQSRCIGCHGPKKQEGRIRLDNLSTDLIKNRAAAENWHEVRNVLNAGEMPPEGEKQLSAKEHGILIRWVSAAIQKSIDAQQKTSGRVVLRRLNRVEFQNTMFDLLGLDMDYSRDLPPDPASTDGFRNNGLSLQMSSLQLEYYLKTARRALDRIIVSGPAPKVSKYEFDKSNVGGWLNIIDRANRLQRQQAFLATIKKDYPEEGEFLVRVKLKAELKPNIGYPILDLSVGYRPDTQILFRSAGTVEITSAEEQVHEFRGRLENHPLPVRGQGKYPGLVIMAENAYDDGSPLPKRVEIVIEDKNEKKDPKKDNEKDKKKKKKRKTKKVFPDEPNLPVISILNVEFEAPVFDEWPPALHRRILFESDLRENDESAYVAAVLKKFMSRAYRRPVEQSEVDRMTNFFHSIRPEFPTFEETIRETLAMVLIRPDFLYLMEPAGEEKRTIGDWELASRLSYFLWSTMPDEHLNELAASGELQKPNLLAAEVDRMLQDERSARFVDQFTEQWLHLNVVDRVAIDPDYYPKFKEELKAEMRRETQQFFAELLRHNLPATNLLSSDFTMLNEPLAKHYGVEGVFGSKFRRVALKPEQHRGGLLGHASILLSNSTGADSHAVRRAVWIRDSLLNDPPAPPPPNVPSLDEAKPEFLKLSVREQLKIHRNTEACASCHRSIDPWGIALENYDAVGLWRENVRRKDNKKFNTQPVNAKDVLPGGQELDGIDGLKNFLVKERKDQFARALVTRLLTYALGRRLELSDEAVIDELMKDFAANDYRLRNLVFGIASCRPFLTK